MYPKWIQHKQDIGQVLVTSEADEKEVRALWKPRPRRKRQRPLPTNGTESNEQPRGPSGLRSLKESACQQRQPR